MTDIQSKNTLELGPQHIGTPFREAVKPESTVDRPVKVEPSDKVVIGVTAKSAGDPAIKDVIADKQNVANQYFELGTPFDYLPADLKDKLSTIDTFVDRLIGENGEKHTMSSYVKTLDGLKAEMFAGEEMSRNEEIDLLAGYASNVMKLDGITDKDFIKRVKTALRGKKSVEDMKTVVIRRVGKLII
jgi:hypothetical protein